MRIQVWIVLALGLLGVGARAEILQVSLETKDGSQINGSVEFPLVTIQSDVGKVELDLTKVSQITFKDGRATVQMHDASKLVGALSIVSVKVTSSLGDMEIPLEKIVQITFTGPAPPPKTVPGTGSSPRTPETSADAVGLTRDAELKPETRLDDTVKLIGRSALSADASRLYYLDATSGKLVSLDTTSMTVFARADVPKSPVSLSLAPGDRALWVVAPGSVSVFDLPALTPRKTFQIEHKLVDVHAISDNLALGALVGSVVVLDADKQAAVAPDFPTLGGPFSPVPGLPRVYQRQGCTTWAPSASAAWGLEFRLSKPDSNRAPAADLLPSRDGRFGLLPTGAVVRLSRSHLADLQECARVSPFVSGIALAEKYLLFTADGFLKIHDSGNFELKTSTKVGIIALEAHGDPNSGKAWVFGAMVQSAVQPGTPSPAGTWFRYKIP